MCDSMTSLRTSLHDAGESERCRDLVYRIFTDSECVEREKLAHGIAKLILDNSVHPAVLMLIEHLKKDTDRMPLIHRALVMAAMAHEPDFLQYTLDTDGTCSSAISEFAVTVLPVIIEKLLNGDMSLPDFVLHGTHAYTAL